MSVFNPEQQNHDLASKIVAGLERVSEAFRVLLWDHAKVIGLSPIQIQILIFVAYHKEELCNVSQLAREFNITKPTVSDAIKVLHKKQLIEKIDSPQDKRAYNIRLSNEGKQLVQHTEHFASPLKKAIANNSLAEQNQFFYQLQKLIQTLNQSGVISPQRSCQNCRFYQKRDGESYCQFLDQTLLKGDLRLDCPEFERKEEL